MWVFIDVPKNETDLARKAGARYHRKSGGWYFESQKYPSSDFARWARLATSESAFNDELVGKKTASLSLHEVAVLTGHSGKIIRALIDDARFPRPVGSAGVSSRSDRWSQEQVQAWLDFNGFGSLVRGDWDKRNEFTLEKKRNSATSRTYYVISDITNELGMTSSNKAFEALRNHGVLSKSDDEQLHNCPTDEYMKTGWFGRVERYFPSNGKTIYQTVVTRSGFEHVKALIIKSMEIK